MKRLFATLMILALLFMAPAAALAAGTVTRTDYSYRDGASRYATRFITLTVTFGADASSPADVALDDITATDSGGAGTDTLAGWWILEVDVIPGATGPADNTDMYLYRPAADTTNDVPGFGAKKIDVLGGNGVDKIDNATISTFNPATTSRPLTGKEILSISNNSVNSATCLIVLTLYR